ncbi:FAD/NAD-binding domain-containing protein [Clavulina sp. PMI_390]|nr:FAD/NAD-binding domain-containing protein [Clavulina sp. PMI_390]
MRVAVVGSGVAGLGAVWALNEYSEHEVHVFEAEARPGGHAHTVDFASPATGLTTKVDVGFVNPPSYPNFLRFLQLLKIPTIPTEMTFSVSRDRGAFEWAGDTIFTVFCQTRNLFRARHWRMIWDVLRFNACAKKLLEDEGDSTSVASNKKYLDLSIGEYLEREGYSDAFRDDYLIPMTAAIWSTPPDKCSLDFPALTLLRFMHNHHLLQLTGKPSWLTVEGGSHLYIKRVLEKLPPQQAHFSSPVNAIKSLPSGGVEIAYSTSSAGGEAKGTFDAVIVATHSDTALEMLGPNATAGEQEILGSFGWNRNEVVLHSDKQLMPVERSAWSCWNYLTESEVGQDGIKRSNLDGLTFMLSDCMNHLQHIPESKYGPVLVTLNPPFEPKAETIVGRWKFDHPIVSAEAVQAQKLLPTIQNRRSIAFAGAWTQYGFHEDGFTSGVKAAQDYIGCQIPFELRSPDRQAAYGRQEIAIDYTMQILENLRRILSFTLFSFFLGLFHSS